MSCSIDSASPSVDVFVTNAAASSPATRRPEHPPSRTLRAEARPVPDECIVASSALLERNPNASEKVRPCSRGNLTARIDAHPFAERSVSCASCCFSALPLRFSSLTHAETSTSFIVSTRDALRVRRHPTGGVHPLVLVPTAAAEAARHWTRRSFPRDRLRVGFTLRRTNVHRIARSPTSVPDCVRSLHSRTRLTG